MRNLECLARMIALAAQAGRLNRSLRQFGAMKACTEKHSYNHILDDQTLCDSSCFPYRPGRTDVYPQKSTWIFVAAMSL